MIDQLCPCGSGLPSTWRYDARGIELCRTCVACHEQKMAGYRTDVIENPLYDAEEDIEPEPAWGSDDWWRQEREFEARNNSDPFDE